MTNQATETVVESTTDDVTDAAETPGSTEPETTAEEGRKGNPEAAKWRTKFRDAETQIEALTQRVAYLQRAEASRLATGAGLLIDGDDVFRGRTLADLLDEDGNVSLDLVQEAVASIREIKPHLGKPYLDKVDGIGATTGSRPASWADVIRS